MAGLCVTLGDAANGDVVESVAAECAGHLDRYDYERLYAAEDLVVYSLCYPDYPIHVSTRDGFTFFVEGHIYDVEDYDAAAEFVHSRLAANDRDAITDWLRQRDGDFLLYHVDEETGQLTVISDVLGRIPFFYASPDDSTTVAGRSIHFIKRVLEETGGELSMDRRANAQTLLLGYAFDRRTPFEEVSKTGPASFVELADGTVSDTQLHAYRFDQERHTDRTVEENAARVADRLVETCRRRASLAGDHVVSLSGGMDSRLVAAALAEAGADFSAASYYTGRNRATRDARTAMDVVQALNLDWELLHARNTAGHMEDLLYRKGGLNTLGMGFLADFFEKLLASRDGPVHHYTGDFGALLDSAWSVYRHFSSAEEAAEWIVEHYATMPIEDVAALTGYTRADLVGFIADRLTDFPEADLRGNVEHFLTRERGLNRDFHGEDRNRTFLWTHAPINSRPVMSYLIDTPRAQKKDRRFYTELFQQLDPALLEINYAPFGAPMGSREQLLKEKANEFVSNQSWVQDVAFSVLFDESGPPDGIADYVETQTARGLGANGSLERERLLEFVENADGYSPVGAYELLTITTLAEYVSDGSTTLELDRTREFETA